MSFILQRSGDRRQVFHAGELAMQQRLGVEDLARELQDTIVPRLSAGHARFIGEQHFFFVSALGVDGLPLAQVVPRVEVAEGTYPLLVIESPQTFYFMLPEATAEPLCAASRQGAGKAGFIFVDFTRRARLRVNGRLQWLSDATSEGFRCPDGHRLMRVDVEQVYANCGARIVKMEAMSLGPTSSGLS